MYKKDMRKIIGNIIFITIIFFILFIIYFLSKKYNFNDYEKSEYYYNKTNFTRDNKIKYSKQNSYKLKSEEYNDAIFYKTIKVNKNTPYKVTCMVKTENVQTQKDNSIAGACISIIDTTEISNSVTQTQEWKKIELLFDSKNREEIKIGFRLRTDTTTIVSGTAWFSDFTIESGELEKNTEWNFAFFLCDNINTNININGNEENININMSQEDKKTIAQDAQIFKNSIKKLSGDKITANVNIYEIKEPLTTLSYEEENGYYVSSKDIEPLIDKVIKENKFDHIFIIVRFGDIMQKKEIPVNDWIGLGYMDYYGIGFSNIRLPNSSKDYIYKYNASTNLFPEEVFVHEFLHSLERNLNERNYNIPELHSYNKYGYTSSRVEGLKQWYSDYMQKHIKTPNGYIGLDEDVYTIKPVKESCFEYSTKLEYFEEPKTIFGELGKLFSKII